MESINMHAYAHILDWCWNQFWMGHLLHWIGRAGPVSLIQRRCTIFFLHFFVYPHLCSVYLYIWIICARVNWATVHFLYVQNVLEVLNWADNVDYCGLLVISDVEQVPLLSKLNDCDDLSDITSESDWMLSKFNDRDDLSDVMSSTRLEYLNYRIWLIM